MTVLIAGAGPVGLAAANVLADAGVAVTVLEAEPRLPENLRASTFQPPTLDLLARFGATARLIEMGRVARKVQYRDRTGWIAELDFGVLEGDTQHPYRVQCEQYRLNQVLAQRLDNVRFGAQVTAVEEEGDAEIISDASIERRLQRVHPKSGRYEIAHRTLYPVHQRVAQSYRRGRVFLAGDAAHLNNPLGGMGMNGGIHDAFNLAEKLAGVIRGEKPPEELERYERQRRPVALEYVNTITIANKRHLEMRDAEEQRRWRAELSRAMADRTAEREYMLMLSMIASLRKYACA